MRILLLLLPLFLTAKVYDCFMFNHELDLLEIRLHEMAPYVDHFVLVECAETHQGKPKPLYFDMNKGRFAQFKEKIIHVKVNDRLPTNDVWQREGWQRDQIQRGLKNCSRKDIIVISDLDEIIRGSDLKKAFPLLKKHPIVGYQLDLFVHYLNGFIGQWNGPVVTTYKFMKNFTPNKLRGMRNSLNVIPNAGWHFSSAGGVEANVIKLACSVHAQECTRQQIEYAITSTPCIPIDAQFPQYVIDNLANYIQRGWIKEDCTISRLSIGTRIVP